MFQFWTRTELGFVKKKTRKLYKFCIRKRIKLELIKFLSCKKAVFNLLHVGVARKTTGGIEKKKSVEEILF